MSVKARTAEAILRVSPHTVEAMRLSPEDSFPAVLATSRLAELMELAAARLMKTHLRAGESSVAIAMDVWHSATTTTAGGMLRAVASHAGVAGRMHRFTVNVFDESGLIASGEHTRAVLIERRLSALARRRAGKPAMLLKV